MEATNITGEVSLQTLIRRWLVKNYPKHREEFTVMEFGIFEDKDDVNVELISNDFGNVKFHLSLIRLLIDWVVQRFENYESVEIVSVNDDYVIGFKIHTKKGPNYLLED